MRRDAVRRGLCAAALVLLAMGRMPLGAQQIREMQFANQPITDILLALAEASRRSIVPDETVTGTASYFFSETDFDTALQVFLSTYKMYLRKEEGVYYVSRIRAEYDAQSRAVSLDADGVEVLLIIRAASRAMGKTILFDALPSQSLTIHATGVTPEKLLEIITKAYTDYTVEADQDYYYIRRVARPAAAGTTTARGAAAPDRVDRKGDLFSMNVEKERFLDVLDELFIEGGREYSLLVKRDVMLEKLRFEDKPFDRLLRLLLDQASADYALLDGVYYVFEIQQRDVLRKLDAVVRIPLVHVSARELANLLPPDLLSPQTVKIDATQNSVILAGSVEEIGPIEQFIRRIDTPVGDRSYALFRLDYLSAARIQSLLPPEYRSIDPIAVPEGNSFVALMSPEGKAGLTEYLALIDKPPASAAVRLRYLKAEELLRKLPPSIAKDEIVETADPSLVFLKASPGKLEDALREIDLLDRPIPQIRYQFLVVQYSQGHTLNWSDSVEASFPLASAQNAFLGTIGNLINLSFDIVSTFGFQFAVKLSLDLSTNDARVLADTSVTGLSGKEVTFQNTETFRYQEVEVDEEGKSTFTGVTREIASGLIFRILGWVSGDGMITMDVKATVSKRGTSTSQTVGSLPPTSENIVNTQVRTAAGKPVVIGGLIRQERGVQVTKVPLLGDIPLLGLLFQSRKETLDNSELAIYILPCIEHGEAGEPELGLRLEELYRKFVKR